MLLDSPLPAFGAYSVTQAVLRLPDLEGSRVQLTQSLRALPAGRGVTVQAVLAGPVDTDMTRGVDIPEVSPESVARAIFDSIEKEEKDIFPIPCPSLWLIADS